MVAMSTGEAVDKLGKFSIIFMGRSWNRNTKISMHRDMTGTDTYVVLTTIPN